MDKQTFLNKINEVAQADNDITRNTLLTELIDGVSEVYDNTDNLNTQITTLNTNLTKVNEDLDKAQKANMDLFLRVNAQKTGDDNKSLTGIDKEPEKRKFEDLFKEGKESDK